MRAEHPRNAGRAPLWSSRGYKLQVAVLFEPRDLWCGVYWTRTSTPAGLFVYLCLVPCLPLRLWIGPLECGEG